VNSTSGKEVVAEGSHWSFARKTVSEISEDSKRENRPSQPDLAAF
jgi:hypothetical protein